MKTLVIMPTYNELASLEATVMAVLKHAPEVDVLVVDDGSPDGTGLLADGLAQGNARVSVLHRTEKLGLGAAYLAGFNWGFERGYSTLVEMDADGSHRAEDLPKLLARTQEAELVIGSRWVDGGAVVNWPWYRKAISKGGTRYADLMLGSKIKDMTAGFRAYDAEFLKSLDLAGVAARGYAFQVEMAWRTQRAGGRVIEVPIVFVERVEGVSKMTTAIVLEALWLVTKWGLSRLL
jgi:glycosyltransferase involved in cell wall biosynthesis